MGLTALVFNLHSWDMMVQGFYYRDGWFMNERLWVQTIYKYGNIPALAVSLWALALFLRSFKSATAARNRRLSAYLLLVMLVGPGLIVNSILKDNWGRPRPRDLIEFGGRHAYEAPLSYNSETNGKSFPCGHATMGFYFFAPALVLGIKRRSFGKLLFGFAIVYGSLIGLVRIMQGGHFLSDVIFAGAIVYLCSCWLWRLLKLDIDPHPAPKWNPKSLSLWHKVIGISAGLIIVIGVALATPYQQKQQLRMGSESSSTVIIRLRNANVSLSFADSSSVLNSVHGFGFPGSRARLQSRSYPDSLLITQNIKGYFSELSVDLQCVVDTTATNKLLIELERGEVVVNANSSRLESMSLQTGGILRGDHNSNYRITAPKITKK